MRRLLISILGLMILGCGAIKMYPGPERTRDQIAVLEIGAVTVYTLDGEGVKIAGRNKLQILPGEHVLRASHNMGDYGPMPVTYTFMAEAGHAYRFDADYRIGRTLSWRPWIKDAASGMIIGSWE
ncbi:MAG: hypothetical protein HY283_01535 [Nitrospirae bacterium]|nr:hypothetical protein [Nitrospirota bacterium]